MVNVGDTKGFGSDTHGDIDRVEAAIRSGKLAQFLAELPSDQHDAIMAIVGDEERLTNAVEFDDWLMDLDDAEKEEKL